MSYLLGVGQEEAGVERLARRLQLELRAARQFPADRLAQASDALFQLLVSLVCLRVVIERLGRTFEATCTVGEDCGRHCKEACLEVGVSVVVLARVALRLQHLEFLEVLCVGSVSVPHEAVWHGLHMLHGRMHIHH